MNLSPTEVIVILVVALLVFGPQRLPELARQVGGVMRELRRMQDSVRTELNQVINDEPAPPPPAVVAAPIVETGDEPDHTDIGLPPDPEPDPDRDPEPPPSGDDPESGGSFS